MKKLSLILLFLLIPSVCCATNIALVIDEKVVIYAPLEVGDKYSIEREGMFIGVIEITQSSEHYSTGTIVQIVENEQAKDQDRIVLLSSSVDAEEPEIISAEKNDAEQVPDTTAVEKPERRKVSSRSRKTARDKEEQEAVGIKEEKDVSDDEDTVENERKDSKGGEGFTYSDKSTKEKKNKKVFSISGGSYSPTDDYLEGQSGTISLGIEYPYGGNGGMIISGTYMFPFEETFTDGSTEAYQFNVGTATYIHYPKNRMLSNLSYGAGVSYYSVSWDYRDSFGTLSDSETEYGYHMMLRYKTPWNSRWYADLSYHICNIEDFELGGVLLKINYSI